MMMNVFEKKTGEGSWRCEITRAHKKMDRAGSKEEGSPHCIAADAVNAEHFAELVLKSVSASHPEGWRSTDVVPLFRCVGTLLPASVRDATTVWCVAAVYFQRIVHSKHKITRKDSRPFGVVCAMLASKFLVDGSPHATRFARASGIRVLPCVEARALQILEWKLFVTEEDVETARTELLLLLNTDDDTSASSPPPKTAKE